MAITNQQIINLPQRGCVTVYSRSGDTYKVRGLDLMSALIIFGLPLSGARIMRYFYFDLLSNIPDKIGLESTRGFEIGAGERLSPMSLPHFMHRSSVRLRTKFDKYCEKLLKP